MERRWASCLWKELQQCRSLCTNWSGRGKCAYRFVTGEGKGSSVVGSLMCSAFFVLLRSQEVRLYIGWQSIEEDGEE